MNCKTLFCTPGNAGIYQEHGIKPASIQNINNNDEIVGFCKNTKIDLVVVGPEAPLVSGLVDTLQASGIRAFGPTRSAARLEGSKSFMKDLCHRYSIPTAGYECFTDPESAKSHIKKTGAPLVIKADGLAAGKGALVCHTESEAIEAVDQILVQQCFGEAGSSIIIEEYLTGEEASFFALIDGEKILPLTSAQDHKTVGEGDVGENTGGMGAYSPAPVVTSDLEDKILTEIIQPTASAMVKEGNPFKGVLFAGLMISNSTVKLLEYNVRFGDPECQCILMRMKSDLLDLMLRTCDGKLDQVKVDWLDAWAMTVVLASQGYPGPYQKGTVISGVEKIEDCKVFHAGTALNENHQLINTGGRVLGVTSTGKTIQETQRKAYKGIDGIHWPKGFCRRDIGWRALNRQTKLNQTDSTVIR
eukprot:g2054.t1